MAEAPHTEPRIEVVRTKNFEFGVKAPIAEGLNLLLGAVAGVIGQVSNKMRASSERDMMVQLHYEQFLAPYMHIHCSGVPNPPGMDQVNQAAPAPGPSPQEQDDQECTCHETVVGPSKTVCPRHGKPPHHEEVVDIPLRHHGRVALPIVQFLSRPDVLIGQGDGGYVVHHEHWKWEGRDKDFLNAVAKAMDADTAFAEAKRTAIRKGEKGPVRKCCARERQTVQQEAGFTAEATDWDEA